MNNAETVVAGGGRFRRSLGVCGVLCLGLPRYKRPRKVIFADVPRNPMGKIEKPRLRQMYGGAGLVARQNGIRE